ncbi:hypothetical protein KH5_20540 [Urechidicola sp. KH5]
MSRKQKTYIVLLLLLIGAIIFYEASKPTPVNWSPSYSSKHSIPLGAKVMRNELQTLFPNSNVVDIKEAPYYFLKDTTLKGTYIFANNHIPTDDTEFEHILKFAARGNEVFMSSEGFKIDTLNIDTELLITYNYSENLVYKFYHQSFKNTEFYFNKSYDNFHFTKVDTLKTEILGATGYLDNENTLSDEGINFIRIKIGKGYVYLHTFPMLFSNYALLDDFENSDHVSIVLSYLNVDTPTVYWDEYYKAGKSRIASPMHYILTNPALKWAYYTVIIAVLLFVIFEGRREQRVIPILSPLKNQTLAFTRTIANMYYEKSDHKRIAEYRIKHLLTYIKNQLRINPQPISKDYYIKVAARSGNELEVIERLFNYCNRLHQKNTVNKEELMKLNQMIESFKNSIKTNR